MLMRKFVDLAGDLIARHFQGRVRHLEMLKELGTNAEDWFRIELLGVIQGTGCEIMGTNQRATSATDRPDFALRVDNDELLIELKMLPKDRNYRYGWQRFLASPNNKRDFDKVMAGLRSGIIYIYWPGVSDWQRCRKNLENLYAVECLRQDSIGCIDGVVLKSYWAAGGDPHSSAASH